MSEHSQEPHSTTEFESISPAKIAITAQSSESQPAEPEGPTARSGKGRWLLAVLLFVAFVLLVSVFILLPRLVPQPQVLVPESTAQSAPPLEVAPWQEAQQRRERQAAQEVLSALLDKQFELEESQVSLWGQEVFQQAAELARQGDESYRQRAFIEATDYYRQALVTLSELQDNQQEILTDLVNQGLALLDAGNATAAAQQFERLLKIQPDNQVAAQGLRRAKTRDEVLELVAQALALEQKGQLSQALDHLQQAQQLDGDATEVATALTRIKEKRRDRDFTQAMSVGYSALEGGDFSRARQAFQQALKLKPGATEAKTGLEEVAHRITQDRIAAYRREAEALIAKEQWQAALEKYQAVLALDNSLLFAQQGRDRTANRARLDQLLETKLKHPERLTSDQVYQEAQQLLKVAAAVTSPGPRLQHQVERLRTLMEESRTPVTVTIRSDNRTKVVLLRRGSLGNFEQHQLSLLPGKYVLVGKRDGFRDVRKEFVVSANQSLAAITIQCTEKI